MLSSDIPPDVWSIISSFVVSPNIHIALSQTCQTARVIYEGGETWRQLCRSIGLGRPNGIKEQCWKKVYVEVVAHRSKCTVPACCQYGVPPTNVIGDLLPSPAAVMDHIEYFKKTAPVAPHVCPEHSGLTLDELFAGIGLGGTGGYAVNDDGDADGAVDDGSASEDGDGVTHGGPSADQATPPPGPGLGPGLGGNGDFASAIMASFLTMLGVAAPPPGSLNPVAIPGLPDGSAYLFPAAVSHSLNGINLAGAGTPASFTEGANTADPGIPNLPSPPAHVPRLLPLSLKNKDHVPVQPLLHPFLLELGAVQFERFLRGQTTTCPHLLQRSRDGFSPIGIDWDVDDESREDWEERTLVNIKHHPLLERAFATNPPVSELLFRIEKFSFRVVNTDGVTIKDAVYSMDRYLGKPLSEANRKYLCNETEVPGHVCSLDEHKTRLDYIFRRHPNGARAPSNPEMGEAAVNGKVKDVWLRGDLLIAKGVVTYVLHP